MIRSSRFAATFRFCAGAAIAVLLGVSCTRKESSPASTPAAGAPAARKAGPSPLAAFKIPRDASSKPWRVTGAYILICHRDAPAKKPGTTRTREEAAGLARETLARVKQPGTLFEDVAREVSEAPRAKENGGRLGVVPRDSISPKYREIVQPLYAMKIGDVSGILDTSQGFAIVKRLEIVERAAFQVWIQYKGGQGAGAKCERTKDEARQRAEEALKKVRDGSATFADIVRDYSDDTPHLKKIGGFMGIWAEGQLAGPNKPLGDALFSLAAGQVSNVVETPYGFHILRRGSFEGLRVGASQIVVQYKGCERPNRGIVRTKDEARSMAESILESLKTRPTQKYFEKLARSKSDDYHAKKAGSLGLVTRGAISEAWEEKAFSLAPGDVSTVFELPDGFHVVWRWQ